MPPFPPLKVGALYRPGRRSFPERGQYMLRDDGHELALFFASPSGREVDIVSRGEAELGVLVRGSVIFFLYRFGSAGEIDWSDAPFSIHRVPKEERVDAPAVVSGERGRLAVVLIDASSGLVRALRRISLSAVFTAELHAAIRAQAAAPYDPSVYSADLSAAYDRFAHSRQMAARSRRALAGA